MLTKHYTLDQQTIMALKQYSTIRFLNVRKQRIISHDFMTNHKIT